MSFQENARVSLGNLQENKPVKEIKAHRESLFGPSLISKCQSIKNKFRSKIGSSKEFMAALNNMRQTRMKVIYDELISKAGDNEGNKIFSKHFSYGLKILNGCSSFLELNKDKGKEIKSIKNRENTKRISLSPVDKSNRRKEYGKLLTYYFNNK